MKLKRLEIVGFKSFGQKTVLDFNSPITSIVGPNGSGKSNVAEAFQFVLGEQSIKSLRGKKGEDLIFTGNASRLQMARVAVTIDNADKSLPVDFEDVVIERLVYRDGLNEYKINSSKVRLKDIIELLASINIGSTGHHIISQGEADRILNVNPFERKEIIEEALGLKIYHIKKLESKRKLEKTEENIASIQNLRKEIAPHLAFLKRQVEKVEKTRLIREELVQKYKIYFLRESRRIEEYKASLKALRTLPEEKILALESEEKKLEKELTHAQTRSNLILRLQEKEKELREKREQYDDVTRDLGRIEGTRNLLERQIKDEERKLQEARDTAIHIPLKEIRNLRKAISHEIETIIQYQDVSTIKEKIPHVLSLLDELISIHQETDTTETIKTLSAEIIRTAEEEKILVTRVEEIRRDRDGVEAEYQQIQKNIEQEKDSYRDTERRLFEIVSQSKEVRKELADIALKEEVINRDYALFDEELRDAVSLLGVVVGDFRRMETEPGQEMYDENERRADKMAIERLKIRLEDNGALSGEDILKEFNETKERDVYLEKEIEDLLKSAESLKNLIGDLDRTLSEEFNKGLDAISHSFDEFFISMFGGGTAQLKKVLEEKRKPESSGDEDLDIAHIDIEDEPHERREGVDISVSLPYKKTKSLLQLSGGERALTSIALLFAVSQVKPPPFIILDETDAALDEANSKKYGMCLEKLAQKSQLIIITHNRETMSVAQVLYGITMGADGISRLLSVSFDEAVKVAK